MSNIRELEKYINEINWFTGSIEMNVLLERTFEGYWGKASETWESRVTIEIKKVNYNSNTVTLPDIKVVGNRWDGIDDVAGKVLYKLKSLKDE